jgi:hypothetical protein
MAAGPMDIQVMMNKTPVTEKIQSVMDRSAEQHHAHLASEQAKQNEHNMRSVTNIKASDNPHIDERNRKRKEQEKKKRKAPPESQAGHFIDIEA